MLCARTPKMLGVLLVTVSIIATAFGDLVEQPLRLQPEAQRARDGYAPEHTSGYFKVMLGCVSDDSCLALAVR